MNDTRLSRELKRAGANSEELGALEDVADILRHLPAPTLSAGARQRIAGRLPIDIDDEVPRRHVWRWSLVMGGSFAVLAVVFVLSQFALPGTPLYSVKRGLEETRVRVQPDYAEKILENRKEEVQKLTQTEVSPQIITEISKDYQRSYKRAEKQQAKINPSWDASKWRQQWDWSYWFAGLNPSADPTSTQPDTTTSSQPTSQATEDTPNVQGATTPQPPKKQTEPKPRQTLPFWQTQTNPQRQSNPVYQGGNDNASGNSSQNSNMSHSLWSILRGIGL